MSELSYDFRSIKEYQTQFEDLVKGQINELSAERLAHENRISDIETQLKSLETELSSAIANSGKEDYSGRSVGAIESDISALNAEKESLEARIEDIINATSELMIGLEETAQFVADLEERILNSDMSYADAVKELINAMNEYNSKINSIADKVSSYLNQQKGYEAYSDFIRDFKNASEAVANQGAVEFLSEHLYVFPLLTDLLTGGQMHTIAKDFLNAELKGTTAKINCLADIYETYIYYTHKDAFDDFLATGDEDKLGKILKDSGIDISSLARRLADDAYKIHPHTNIATFISLVGTGKPLDLKNRQMQNNKYIYTKDGVGGSKSIWSRNWDVGSISIGEATISHTGEITNYNLYRDYLGNYCFGYYGMQVFGNPWFLKVGAGGAQLLSDNYNSIKNGGGLIFENYIYSIMNGYYGDNYGYSDRKPILSDSEMIQHGIDAYLRSQYTDLSQYMNVFTG